jgi:hypothetical protein
VLISPTIMTSLSEYKNIVMATRGSNDVDDDDSIITLQAEAFASEAIHMANEAKDVAKSLEMIKVTLAMLKEVSHPSKIPAPKSPHMMYPLKKLDVDEWNEKATTPFHQKTSKVDIVIADEKTPFETGKAGAVAKIGASWNPIESKPNIVKGKVKPTSLDKKMWSTKSLITQSSTHFEPRDPSPTPPILYAISAQTSENRDSSLVESICREDLFTKSVDAAIDDIAAETAAPVTGSSNVADQIQSSQASASHLKKKLSGYAKVTTRTCAMVVPDMNDTTKGVFESLLDSFGLDRACGIDDATLAQYVAEEDTTSAPTTRMVRNTPKTASSKFSLPRRRTTTATTTTRYNVPDSFDDVFGATTNDFDISLCGDFESDLAEYNDLKVYYTNTMEEPYREVRSDVKPPKGILKLPQTEQKDQARIELTNVDEPRGVVQVQVDPDEDDDEELEKKSVCFQGAEPDGIKVESFPSQLVGTIRTHDESTASSEGSNIVVKDDDHCDAVVKTIDSTFVEDTISEVVAEPRSEQQKTREFFEDEAIGKDVFEDKGDLLYILDDHLSCM